MSILGTGSRQLFHSHCHTETRTRPTRSQIWILSIARLNCAFDSTDWHAVANCWAALPRRPPSGRIEKNGGMQGEEHLLFLVLTVAGNIEETGNLFPARGQIWTLYLPGNDWFLHARVWGDLFAVFKNSPSHLTEPWKSCFTMDSQIWSSLILHRLWYQLQLCTDLSFALMGFYVHCC